VRLYNFSGQAGVSTLYKCPYPDCAHVSTIEGVTRVTAITARGETR
jgi:hypothetical protein